MSEHTTDRQTTESLIKRLKRHSGRLLASTVLAAGVATGASAEIPRNQEPTPAQAEANKRASQVQRLAQRLVGRIGNQSTEYGGMHNIYDNPDAFRVTAYRGSPFSVIYSGGNEKHPDPSKIIGVSIKDLSESNPEVRELYVNKNPGNGGWDVMGRYSADFEGEVTDQVAYNTILEHKKSDFSPVTPTGLIAFENAANYWIDHLSSRKPLHDIPPLHPTK